MKNFTKYKKRSKQEISVPPLHLGFTPLGYLVS